MRKILGSLLLLMALVFLMPVRPLVWADEPTPTPDPTHIQELEEELRRTQKQIQETQKDKLDKESQLQEVEGEKGAAETTLQDLQANLGTAQNQLTQTLVAIDQKEKEIELAASLIESRTRELEQKRQFLQKTLRAVYADLYRSDLGLFLGADDFLQASRSLVYRQSLLTETRKLILDLEAQITRLQEEKDELTRRKLRLAQEKQNLEAQKRSLEQNIVSTQSQIAALQEQQGGLVGALAGLSARLSSLTAQQQEILAQKAAAALASTTVGDFEIQRAAIEKEAPNDGQLYFSFWSYGYPHRVGMNQYGAYGRAKAGQSAQQILRVYFAGVEIASNYPVPEKIKIRDSQGEREIAFEEDYLLGIGEMPSCWGDEKHGGLEALRAQAIAARTYALAYTGGGAGSICVDQKCQVYVGANKVNGVCGEYWRAAVESTRGQVITYQGEPISAWYASTAGGFTLSSVEVWGRAREYAVGMADLDENFEPFDGPKYGDSPWYHKAWGNEPWLSLEQVADLLNAALLPESFNNQLAREERGGFSPAQVVQTLGEQGIAPVTDLKSIEVFGANSKATTGLRVYYADTYTEIDPGRFRFVFNLRSPGTDAIWTSRFDLLTNR